MSKQNKGQSSGTTVHVKAKRAKTPAQLAKKAKNEQDAAARLLVLQKEQAEFAKVRAEFPDRNLSDDNCRDLIAERAARRTLDVLLACDVQVGGEPFSKRLMRFLGKDTLKGVAAGKVAVREIMAAIWAYASTQDAMLRPTEEEFAG